MTCGRMTSTAGASGPCSRWRTNATCAILRHSCWSSSSGRARCSRCRSSQKSSTACRRASRIRRASHSRTAARTVTVPVPLKVYDESIAVLRRALDAAHLGHSDKLDGMARLDAFTRAIEHGRSPDADVAATIARERSLSRELGGRTVFDDLRRSPRETKPNGQLRLF